MKIESVLAKIFQKPAESESASLDESLESRSVFIKKNRVVWEILGLHVKKFRIYWRNKWTSQRGIQKVR